MISLEIQYKAINSLCYIVPKHLKDYVPWSE
nr:MAG TPA: hypothetical protein [Caudoviricetes sp.]